MMDSRLDAEDLLNGLNAQHLGRYAIGHQAPFMHQDETMKPTQCQAEIVDDSDHCHPLVDQLL
jgi:hypothetical protein